MKTTKTQFTSYLMILLLAGLVMGVMIQFAQAQVPQILQINMPQKSLQKRILENTNLTYYQMFLGPTASGSTSETYNVFQDGRAPLQSFHAVNLRHQISTRWMIGASLAASNTYTGTVENRPTKQNPMGVVNRPGDEFFNVRAYVGLPALKTRIGSFFTTFSYEAPTSVTSRNNDMKYGWVLNENWAFDTGSYRWSAGLMGQVYRMVYSSNLQKTPGFDPYPLQTMIVSGGPYVTYRFNDKWMFGSLLTFDWDQRGNQTNTTKFNNNLPDRVRAGITYLPAIKYFSSVGVFTQTLLQARAESTMFGAELALKF